MWNLADGNLSSRSRPGRIQSSGLVAKGRALFFSYDGFISCCGGGLLNTEIEFSPSYSLLTVHLNQSQGGNYMDSGIKTGLRVSEEFLGGFSFMYFSPWC